MIYFELQEYKININSINHFIHKNFLWITLLLYTAGAILPEIDSKMREVCFGNLIWLDKSEVKLSLPLIMLSFLLFNAGLAAKTQDFKSLLKYPQALILGLTGNILIPILFIYFIKNCLFFWHNPDETQNILVGLAILGSMPIASSSTAWTQNTEGNLGLSLGLVNFSTILSPFSTPVILHSDYL